MEHDCLEAVTSVLKFFADLLDIPQHPSHERDTVPLDFHSIIITSFLDWPSVSRNTSYTFKLEFKDSKTQPEFAEYVLGDDLKQLIKEHLSKSVQGSSDGLSALACKQNDWHMARSALREWSAALDYRFPLSSIRISTNRPSAEID
ncbi:hypothetical protein V865_007182 [Kwoniella europaea PYCC6329]|uniref:Uncharacterized protein n=1 Tax=Kwoniella europaea PYCC6329 TaxID=1423913 RepID=A0AAX4KRP3_9TREE